MDILNLKLQTSFYFSLRISGGSITDSAFQEVTGLTKEMKFEEVASGGENRFKYRLPSRSTYSNLILKRGIMAIDSPLIEWCEDTLDSGLALPIKTKNIELSLLDEKGRSTMSWNFIKAYPIKWAISDLKSQENSLLIETIELAYQYFITNDSRSNEYAGISSMYGDD